VQNAVTRPDNAGAGATFTFSLPLLTRD